MIHTFRIVCGNKVNSKKIIKEFLTSVFISHPHQLLTALNIFLVFPLAKGYM